MEDKDKKPESGLKRFIVQCAYSGIFGIRHETKRVIDGSVVTTPAITIEFTKDSERIWDSANSQDKSGRILLPDELLVVKQWADERVKNAGHSFRFLSETEAEEIIEAKIAKAKVAKTVVGARSTSNFGK